jgi:hypothetical protein
MFGAALLVLLLLLWEGISLMTATATETFGSKDEPAGGSGGHTESRESGARLISGVATGATSVRCISDSGTDSEPGQRTSCAIGTAWELASGGMDGTEVVASTVCMMANHGDRGMERESKGVLARMADDARERDCRGPWER